MIKITIKSHHIYNVFLGIAMGINYMIEGLILYAMYKVINYWYVTGNNWMFWLVVGGVVLLLVRIIVTISIDEPIKHMPRVRHYNWHWLQVWRVGATIRAFLSGKVEIELK